MIIEMDFLSMQVRLKAKPETIAEIETKKAIKTYWKDILAGQDVNLSIFEWQELIVDQYVQIKDDKKDWSGTEETRVYEFVKSIAQLCRARMTTKLQKISQQISDLKKEYTV
jgi:hypothetical protein